MEFDSPADFAIKSGTPSTIDLSLTLEDLDAILENDLVMSVPPGGINQTQG